MDDMVRKVTHARKRNHWADRDELLHRCRGLRHNHLCYDMTPAYGGFGVVVIKFYTATSPTFIGATVAFLGIRSAQGFRFRACVTLRTKTC